jgi:hypothetical protein
MSLPDPEDLVKEIISSGILGRSEFYPKLLNYLLCHHKAQTQPKELDIAIEVFGRGKDFDSTQDSFVRVYVHNLRQKIDQYYDAQEVSGLAACRITIPKGGYGFVIKKIAAPSFSLPRWLTREQWFGCSLFLFVTLCAVSYFALKPGQTSPLAGPSLELINAYPTKVVVGDYYLFGEMDPRGNITRLIRDFEINSASDLDDLFMYNSELVEQYYDVGLTYLPVSIAPAIFNTLAALKIDMDRLEVIPASLLQASDLLNNNIVYIGLFSGLSVLEDVVFEVSTLELGITYDELIDENNGNLYMSQAGSAMVSQGSYVDYGYIATFKGSSNSQFLIIAGTRDEGLFQAAKQLQDPDVQLILSDTINSNGIGTELLFQANGFANTSLGSELVMQSALDASNFLN